MAGHERAGWDELLCESNSNARKAKQRITKATFEKWQKGLEMKHQMLSWLRSDLDAKGTHVVSLYCAICRKYQADIQLFKNFRRDWIVGSTNQRTSNLIDHATLTEDSFLKPDDRQCLKGYLLKVMGYSSLISFNCACPWMTLHGLWTDATSAVKCLFFFFWTKNSV